MADKTKTPACDLYDQAVTNCEQFFKANLKLQEDATRCWTDCMAQMPAVPETQKRLNSLIIDALPNAQKGLEDWVKLVEQTGRMNIDLLKQSLQTTPAQSAAVAQEKMKQLWVATLAALRANVQAVTQTNGRLMETWMHAVPKDMPGFSAKAKAA